MKRVAIILLLLTASAWGQGSSIYPYVTPLWRTFLDGTTADFQADTDSATFFTIKDAAGNAYLTVDTDATPAVTWQLDADSTTAFQWKDAAGAEVVTIDSTNHRMIISDTSNDAEIRFITATQPHEMQLFVDSGNASADLLRIRGLTVLKNTGLDVIAQDGESCVFRFFSGESNFGQFTFNNSDNFVVENTVVNKDLALRVNDGGVTTEVIHLEGITAFVGIHDSFPETLLELTHATPYIQTNNSTQEATGRESRWIAKGFTTTPTQGTLGRQEWSQDGVADGFGGKWVLSTNANAGADTLVDVITIDSAQETHIGDGGTTDYGTFEADGTLEFNGAATVWDDLRVPASAVRLGGAQPPTDTAYKGGMVLAFPTTGDKTIYFTAQLPHSYKEGTDIEFHIHWTIPSSGAGGGAENVKWDLTYSWANMASTFPAESTGTITVDVQNDVLDDHMYDGFTDLSGAGKTISSMLICSLTRDVSVANDFGDSAYLLEVDFHFELDTVGSRTEAAK